MTDHDLYITVIRKQQDRFALNFVFPLVYTPFKLSLFNKIFAFSSLNKHIVGGNVNFINHSFDLMKCGMTGMH
jgi:hypothetical protein